MQCAHRRRRPRQPGVLAIVQRLYGDERARPWPLTSGAAPHQRRLLAAAETKLLEQRAAGNAAGDAAHRQQCAIRRALQGLRRKFRRLAPQRRQRLRGSTPGVRHRQRGLRAAHQLRHHPLWRTGADAVGQQHRTERAEAGQRAGQSEHHQPRIAPKPQQIVQIEQQHPQPLTPPQLQQLAQPSAMQRNPADQQHSERNAEQAEKHPTGKAEKQVLVQRHQQRGRRRQADRPPADGAQRKGAVVRGAAKANHRITHARQYDVRRRAVFTVGFRVVQQLRQRPLLAAHRHAVPPQREAVAGQAPAAGEQDHEQRAAEQRQKQRAVKPIERVGRGVAARQQQRQGNAPHGAAEARRPYARAHQNSALTVNIRLRGSP